MTDELPRHVRKLTEYPVKDGREQADLYWFRGSHYIVSYTRSQAGRATRVSVFRSDGNGTYVSLQSIHRLPIPQELVAKLGLA